MKKEGEHEVIVNLYRAIINSKELDMLHLGNTLHENVAQELYAIRLLLQRFILNNGKTEEIDTIKKRLNSIISEVQQIANHLLPTVLRDLGFAKAIDELILQSKKKSIKFTINIDSKIRDLSIHFQSHIYRIILEFFEDISGYHEITEISIKVKLTNDLLVIQIFDNRGKSNALEVEQKNEFLKFVKNSILYYDGIFDIQNKEAGMKLLITLNTKK